MSNFTEDQLAIINAGSAMNRPEDRIKQEHAELVEALTWIVDQVDRFGGITIENNHSAFEKFRAILEKMK